MKSDILSLFFAEFCESHVHLDSMLSQVHPHQRPKVARYMSAFLRRPLTLAEHFNIPLAESPEAFWDLSFVKLKKHEGIHQLLSAIWQSGGEMPNEGGVQDFPPHIIAQWEKDWGKEATTQMARLLSQEPLTTIRAHRRTRDLETDEGTNWLESFEVKAREGYYSPVARVFKGFAPVQKTQLFTEGYYEIQDEGSQVMSMFALNSDLVAPMLSETPALARKKFTANPNLIQAFKSMGALTVIDACAGAGGKTLAMADLLQGQGRIYGYDIYEKKIQNLKRRAERAQERNIQGVVLERDPTAQIQSFYGKADRVLIDSPCTGLGVLRRNPDIKWNRKPLNAEVLAQQVSIDELQHTVVKNYAPLVKVGGEMTYGVCAFSKAETTDQVKWIQENFPDFQLKHQGFIGPHETDGFFMASFVRVK
jgi:16S rRNA C967 or C1407 C5-methylase (RsmB/RsmF family)